MRNHAEAATLAAAHVTEIAGYAGGRTRRVAFEYRPSRHDNVPPAVSARLFATDIVTWYPDGSIKVATGGYNTASTFDGIAAALNISRARVGMVKKVPYVNGHDLSSGTVTITLNPETKEEQS